MQYTCEPKVMHGQLPCHSQAHNKYIYIMKTYLIIIEYIIIDHVTTFLQSDCVDRSHKTIIRMVADRMPHFGMKIGHDFCNFLRVLLFNISAVLPNFVLTNISYRQYSALEIVDPVPIRIRLNKSQNLVRAKRDLSSIRRKMYLMIVTLR